MTHDTGFREPTDETTARPWVDLFDTGVLWAINRALFHPRGFALALETDTKSGGVVLGWSLHGDGSEPWKFTDDALEDQRFAAFEALLAGRRAVQP